MWDTGDMCMNLCMCPPSGLSLGAAASPEASNTPGTHEWQTQPAVILLVSALMCYSHTLIPLPHFTSSDWTLFFSLSLNALSYLIPTTSPFSIFISRLPYFLFCLCLYLFASQVVRQHTGVKNQCRCPISDGARTLLRHRWLHTSLYKFTHVFRPLGKRQCNEWWHYQFYSVFHWNTSWRDWVQGQWAPSEEREGKTIFEHLLCI